MCEAAGMRVGVGEHVGHVGWTVQGRTHGGSHGWPVGGCLNVGHTWRVRSAARHAGEAVGQVSRGVQGIRVAGRRVWAAWRIGM